MGTVEKVTIPGQNELESYEIEHRKTDLKVCGATKKKTAIFGTCNVRSLCMAHPCKVKPSRYRPGVVQRVPGS
jgi:hypothetical protein